MEHVEKFMDAMGPHVADPELCLKEFSKSLTGRAYTWYTTLEPGSIHTWKEMVEKFCQRYFQSEERVTSITLQNNKQGYSEGFVDFVKRF